MKYDKVRVTFLYPCLLFRTSSKAHVAHQRHCCCIHIRLKLELQMWFLRYHFHVHSIKIYNYEIWKITKNSWNFKCDFCDNTFTCIICLLYRICKFPQKNTSICINRSPSHFEFFLSSLNISYIIRLAQLPFCVRSLNLAQFWKPQIKCNWSH